MSHIGYEVFGTEDEWNTHESSIKTLLGVPCRGTTGYRDKISHPTSGEYAGTVESKLVDATASLSDADCVQYYDRNNLVAGQNLTDDGWWPES